MENIDLGKDLNQFLPSNILNDIDINADENNQFDEEEEIADDLAYHLKPGTNPIPNQPIRFYSDSNVFFRAINKKDQPTMIQNQQNSVMNYAMMQSMNNPLFSPNTPNLPCYNNKGIGLPFQNIQIERKRTDPYFFNSSFTNELFLNQMNNPNNTSYISYNSRKKTNSSSNFNPAKTKASTKSAKGSFDSTSMHFSRKLSEINIEQFEIEDFNNYIDSLHCDLQEYICSQKGSKEMQKYLNKSPSECKTILFNMVKANSTKIMMDKCGNYFFQQLFLSCSTTQLLLLMNYVKNDIVQIAHNSSGTHALQSLIDSFTSNEQETLILSSIQGHEIEMMYDSNATHVLQKLLTCIREENRTALTNLIVANIVQLCYDPNGICVAKKVIKTASLHSNKLIIIKAITNDCFDLAQNAYGNYAIQFIFEEWSIADYPEMIKIFINNIELLSIQKFSSNVVEKLIEFLDETRKCEIFNKIFNSASILRILKMRYGKYVLQKSIKCMSSKQKKEIKKALLQMNSSTQKENNKLESFISHFDD